MNYCPPPSCSILDWDSKFFGIRIARVSCGPLDVQSIRKILEWCSLERIRCLYYLAESNDPITLKTVEENGFRLADLRLTFDRAAEAISTKELPNKRIRIKSINDLSYLKEIASVCHLDSRFYCDENFPRILCNSLYETWIEKSCLGMANEVFVAEHEGRPTGYITCLIDNEGNGSIGLLGVAERAHGQGLGRQLVECALHWFKCQGCQNVTVVTQGRNVRAQRLYQRCGFLTKSIQLWYHKWFQE